MFHIRFYLANLYYSVQAQYIWTRYSPDVAGLDAHLEFLEHVDSLRDWLGERVGTTHGLRADWYYGKPYLPYNG